MEAKEDLAWGITKEFQYINNEMFRTRIDVNKKAQAEKANRMESMNIICTWQFRQ